MRRLRSILGALLIVGASSGAFSFFITPSAAPALHHPAGRPWSRDLSRASIKGDVITSESNSGGQSPDGRNVEASSPSWQSLISQQGEIAHL